MKSHLRNYVTSALLMLPASFVMVALPTSALAQPAAPEVDTLDIEADAGLAPGSRLRVRLVATPRLKASLRIRGLRQSLPLRETSPGVYVTRYTMKNTDRLTSDAPVRALLTRGNRTTGFEYVLSDTMDVATAPPVAVAPPAPAPVPQLRIERFGMLPIERIEPGAELNFAVEGLPGATVSIDLPGVERDLRLRETRPGHYEGGYTIRRADDFNPNRPIVATMRSGDRVVTANLNMQVGRPGADNRPPSGDNRPPTLIHLVPSEGATVAAGSVHVAATFDDAGGSGVDPASVQLVVSGRNVTREAQINRQSLSFWSTLPAGRQTVDVTARDQAGNVVRKSWSFTVAAAAIAAQGNIPIQVLNHNNNGQVGQGPTTVQGRTGPNATVAVTVQASAPLGGVVNIQQNLLQQTVQADGNGNFAFTFTPQFTLPGTRYDVLMVSTRANVSHETRMALIQR